MQTFIIYQSHKCQANLWHYATPQTTHLSRLPLSLQSSKASDYLNSFSWRQKTFVGFSFQRFAAMDSDTCSGEEGVAIPQAFLYVHVYCSLRNSVGVSCLKAVRRGHHLVSESCSEPFVTTLPVLEAVVNDINNFMNLYCVVCSVLVVRASARAKRSQLQHHQRRIQPPVRCCAVPVE